MRRLALAGVMAALLLTLTAPAAHAWLRSPAAEFAALPPGVTHPEGLTADAQGNIYATTFFPASDGVAHVVVFHPSGRLLRDLPIADTQQLLGLGFHPTTGALLVIDFGNHRVLTVDPVAGTAGDFATMPPGSGLNALTFDAAGNVYVSDSFGGTIWKTGPTGGATTAWVTSDLLKPSGVPPFGANGIAFDKAGTRLLVANTANDTVVEVPVVSGGAAGTPKVLVNSINGADGLLVDDQDNIWVAANQADEIVVIDPTGRAIAKLGDFGGIDPQGAPIGLLFPASPVLSNGFLYVTNLSLDLRLVSPDFNAVDSPWAAAVTVHTIARIPARIPPVPGAR